MYFPGQSNGTGDRAFALCAVDLGSIPSTNLFPHQPGMIPE